MNQIMGLKICLLFCALYGIALGAERINQEGRILGPLAPVTVPTLFNTPEADAIVSTMQIFPVTSAWNEDISKRPLLSNSAAMIAQITADLASNRRTLRLFTEMNYVLVPDTQPLVPINFFNYPDESDPSPYPIPLNLPIESWPVGTDPLTLNQWQLDTANTGGDRHSIVAMPGQGTIWETWLTKLEPAKVPPWQASNGAKFDLKSNTLRPDGWTSGDAAGLPMFPALVRYDECERGMVEHAMRLVVKHSRAQHIYPATHHASSPSTLDPNTPAMGQRLRLQSGFTIPSTWSKEEKAVALALKKYGAIVADNGNFFSISICPDNRFPSGCFDNINALAISNFEVIQTTDAASGPRAPNAPAVNAGADQTVSLASGASLSATATGAAATYQWYLCPNTVAPGTVNFGASTSLACTATFSAAGTYTLMLSADDGAHARAFDAVNITVTVSGNNPAPTLASLSPSNANSGGAAFTLALNGTNFVPSTVVNWTGKPDLVPVTQSPTQITVSVPAAYIAAAGSANITVTNPGPGGGISAPQTFTINPPGAGAPTVATAPSATPASVSGTTTQLSVLGSSATAAESTLTYTWAEVGTPPAPVTFSPNGTNPSKNTSVTFTGAGVYNLQVTIQDATAQSVTSSPLTVTVTQTLTKLTVSPATATLLPSGQLQFGAITLDQFNASMAASVNWAIAPAAGTISNVGLLAAAAQPGGPFTLTVSAGALSATSSVTLSATATPGTFASGPSAGTSTGTAGDSISFSATPSGAGQFTYAWNFGDGTTDTSGGSVTHTFTAAGTYTVTVSAVDAQGNVTTGTLPFTVSGGSGGQPGGNKIAMTVSKLHGGVKPATPGHDFCSLSGTIPNLPALFDPTGQALVLTVNGARVDFTLDSHGRAKAAQGLISLSLKPSKRNKATKKLEFLGGNVIFKATIMKGDWSATWGIPQTVGKNTPVPQTVDLVLNNLTYEAAITALYTGTPAKGGSLKK